MNLEKKQKKTESMTKKKQEKYENNSREESYEKNIRKHEVIFANVFVVIFRKYVEVINCKADRPYRNKSATKCQAKARWCLSSRNISHL